MKIKNLELYYVGKIIQPLETEETNSHINEMAIEIGPLILVKQNNSYKDIKTQATYSKSEQIGISRVNQKTLEPLSSYYSDSGKKIKEFTRSTQKVYEEVEELIDQGYIKTLNLYSHRHQFWLFKRKNK